MKRSGSFTMLVGLALTLVSGLAVAQEPPSTKDEITKFDLVTRSSTCLPDAHGEVTVLHREEERGTDTLFLRASGLPANTQFTVFLTEFDAFATPAVGAAVYIGDFTTNDRGRGSLKVDTIVGEAFVSSRDGNPPVRVRHDLDKVVIWFADPTDASSCFGAVTTPFDGDGAAGPQALSSQGPTGLEKF